MRCMGACVYVCVFWIEKYNFLEKEEGFMVEMMRLLLVMSFISSLFRKSLYLDGFLHEMGDVFPVFTVALL